jgi:hypothetical protein
MLTVSRNQSGWKEWVEDDHIRGVLERAAMSLKWAWNLDKKSANSYPLNTSYLFAQIKERLRGQPRGHAIIKLPRPPHPPQRFAELVDERIIGSVYEDLNQGSYKDALRQAATGFGEGLSAWRKILRAAEGAYAIEYYGVEFAPKPRVHFLHRNLLVLAATEHLRGLSDRGIAELFDDICPCGRSHKPNTIGKLRKRAISRRRLV